MSANVRRYSLGGIREIREIMVGPARPAPHPADQIRVFRTLFPQCKEAILANNSKEARDRAEASFKKQEQRAREGAKAMADYEAEGRAMREKTARLKSLRMAKEAAEKGAK
jgi:hypothetical protein